MNRGPHSRPRGFTLLEILVVIAIILILAAITVGSFSFVNDKKRESKARVDIGLLSKALEEYKLDYGDYPPLDLEDTDMDGDISEELYNALFYEGWDSKQNDDGSIKIYLPELDPRNSKQKWVERVIDGGDPPQDLKILDPWGEPYRFRKGDLAQNPDFDLWSIGKDKTTDSADPSRSADGNKDDIRNF